MPFCEISAVKEDMVGESTDASIQEQLSDRLLQAAASVVKMKNRRVSKNDSSE